MISVENFYLVEKFNQKNRERMQDWLLTCDEQDTKQQIQVGHLVEVYLSLLPGNLRPCLVLPRLIHLCDLKSKNSTIFKFGSASEAPPATMTPSRPLTRALTQEC